MKNEIWVDIKGFEGYYQVSNYGNVRSVQRLIKNKHGYRLINGKVLKKLNSFDGYHSVQLRRSCTKTCLLVHRIVAEHFLIPVKGMGIVNHLDAIKTNNYYLNLEWTNKSGNLIHAINMGKLARNEKGVLCSA